MQVPRMASSLVTAYRTAFVLRFGNVCDNLSPDYLPSLDITVFADRKSQIMQIMPNHLAKIKLRRDQRGMLNI